MEEQTVATKKKILIIEDEDLLANVYVRRFDVEGFETKRVSNGEEAVASAKEYKPNLILLDLMLPGINGLDVLDALRKDPETKEITVIVFSALGQESDRTRALELGANDYIVKSYVVLTDVVEKIRGYLEA
jgi:two-component system phosphate regulon response regulator PhoB